jgi:hypothetical protein
VKRFYFIFFSLVLSITTFPQYSPTKVVNDFKISTDNSPSTIIQSNPKLFCNGTKGFLVVWEDNRWSDAGFAAQYFDSLGNPVGKNFKIFSNEGITFSNNNTFTTVKSQWFSSYYMGDILSYSGRNYSINGSIGNSFILANTRSECDICCTGIDYQIISFPDYFMFLMRDEGIVSLTKYDHSGNLISQLEDYNKFPFGAGNLSIARNNTKYILAYFNTHENDYNGDSTAIGIYVNIYNNNDSLLFKNILIRKFNSDFDGCYYEFDNVPIVKTFCISDSLFEIFWINKDLATFNFIIINDSGEILNDINTLLIPFTKHFNSTPNIQNIRFSSFRNNGFAAAEIVMIYDNFEKKAHYYNSLYYFDSKGKFIRQIVDSISNLNFSEQFFKISDSTFYISSQINGDIFLTTINNLNIIENRKINDDEVGSNETNPRIVTYDNQNNFVTWDNEISHVGQKVKIDGDLVDNPVILEGNKVVFNTNGDYFNIWKKYVSPDSILTVFSVYNSKFQLLKEEIVQLKRYYSIDANITSLNDSTFILYIYEWAWPNYSTFVRMLNNKFEKTYETSFSGSQYSSVKFFRENDISFWISFPNSLQLYSSKLEPLSSVYNLSTHLYLGNNNFLTTYNVCPSYIYNCNEKYGTVFTTNCDTLNKKFRIASNANEFRLALLPNNDFLAIWNNNNWVYARAFSKNGIAKTDSFLIHSDIQSLKKQPTVGVNGDKVFFAWADARNEGRGYDIYGSIFDLSKIVKVDDQKAEEIPKQFVLYQNYPNPFNPKTKIKFVVPTPPSSSPLKKGRNEVGFVTLKVYDILGNEVASLVNEQKPAGNYEVEFDGSNLSSGVYFYQLKAGNFLETKKFVMLK